MFKQLREDVPFLELKYKWHMYEILLSQLCVLSQTISEEKIHQYKPQIHAVLTLSGFW